MPFGLTTVVPFAVPTWKPAAGGVREAEERRVRDAVELLAHGCVDLRPAVPVHVDPQRGVAVEVATTVLVDQPGALAGRDHERVLPLPVGLLRERVPEPQAVELGDRGAYACHGRDSVRDQMV
jgi:hypothetical protein